MMKFEHDAAQIVKQADRTYWQRFHKYPPYSELLAMTRCYVLTEFAAKEYASHLASLNEPLPDDPPNIIY